jgi:hypothetical protein
MMNWARIIFYVLTLRCDEAERIRCAPDPELVKAHQSFGESMHRCLCKSCRRAKRKLETMNRALERLGTGAEVDLGEGLSPEARQRLRDALEENSE